MKACRTRTVLGAPACGPFSGGRFSGRGRRTAFATPQSASRLRAVWVPGLALAAGQFLGGCTSNAGSGGDISPAVALEAAKSETWGTEGAGRGQFKGPRAVAVSPDGFVYVADRASRISKWTTDGKFVKDWMAPVVSNGRFEGPEGMCVLPGGDVAMTNTHASRVLIYSPEGKLLTKFGSYGEGKGQFLLVTGICADAEGNIYTADYGGYFDRISKWTRQGKLLASWAGHGEGPRQFRRPCGLAISAEGDLLVADIGNHRIQILDRNTGAYKGQFSTRGREPGQLTYPYGVAVDGSGFIYTVEYSLHRMQIWNKDHTWLAAWGGPGRGPNQLYNPWGLAVDGQGNVYIADTNNNRIQKIHMRASG